MNFDHETPQLTAPAARPGYNRGVKTDGRDLLHDSTRTNVETLRRMFQLLEHAHGPQGWWPVQRVNAEASRVEELAKTEIVVGAILTQNTAWTNVEHAIVRLHQAEKLSWPALRDLPETDLADLIRPAGTFRVKAARLKAFVKCLWREHGGSLQSLLSGDLEVARRRLLSIHGIGRETADAILLYAGGRPSFVVDAYTMRILRRHGIINDRQAYDTVRALFHNAIRPEPSVYNEFHALFVAVGKRHCRKRANCTGCPLESLPHDETAC